MGAIFLHEDANRRRGLVEVTRDIDIYDWQFFRCLFRECLYFIQIWNHVLEGSDILNTYSNMRARDQMM